MGSGRALNCYCQHKGQLGQSKVQIRLGLPAKVLAYAIFLCAVVPSLHCINTIKYVYFGVLKAVFPPYDIYYFRKRKVECIRFCDALLQINTLALLHGLGHLSLHCGYRLRGSTYSNPRIFSMDFPFVLRWRAHQDSLDTHITVKTLRANFHPWNLEASGQMLFVISPQDRLLIIQSLHFFSWRHPQRWRNLLAVKLNKTLLYISFPCPCFLGITVSQSSRCTSA